jgi:outer membrane lipoprotein carrier protein
MWLRVFWMSVFFSQIPAAVHAEPDAVATLVQRFEHRYRGSNTLQATFLERYLENGKEVRSESGMAYFGKPGKMRWEYQSPERNLFVVDGKWSWFYVPADHAATRIPAKQSSDWRTPLALLAGEMKVSRICAHVQLDPRGRALNSGGVLLQCLLRGSQPEKPSNTGNAVSLLGSQAASVSFELSGTTGELLRIVMFDPGGVEIEFRFADWQFDPRLDGSKFRFEPPVGVAIVDGDMSVPGSDSSSAAGAGKQPKTK